MGIFPGSAVRRMLATAAMAATLITGSLPVGAAEIVAYTGNRLKVYSAPGERIRDFPASLLPDPGKGPIPILQINSPYLQIEATNGQKVWLTTATVKIVGPKTAVSTGYKSADPCVGRVKAVANFGNGC